MAILQFLMYNIISYDEIKTELYSFVELKLKNTKIMQSHGTKGVIFSRLVKDKL
jgi:hypothetical protein